MIVVTYYIALIIVDATQIMIMIMTVMMTMIMNMITMTMMMMKIMMTRMMIMIMMIGYVPPWGAATLSEPAQDLSSSPI